MSDEDKEVRIDQLKKELFELQNKRKKLEDELVMHKVVLESNKVGMRDSLTDKDDFPRNDIDVYAVRHARSAINTLEFDAKDILNQMQSRLEELHALTKPQTQS